jgi:uncharacterized protein with predicted RNA binding PUA domain
MSTESSQSSALRRIRTIADYQFGRGAGKGLFPEDCTFTRSTTGRIRQIYLEGVRLATVRAQDGRLTLSIEGARRLHHTLPFPTYRVTIQGDVAEFPRKGKNVFARHVNTADREIRSGDEVLVVTDQDELLATGAAVLSGEEMLHFKYGVAVKVRQGCESTCSQEE